MIKLSNSIKVYVPATTNEGKRVNLDVEIKNALSVIGGATTYKATGNWVDNNTLYTDDMSVMQFNAMSLDDDVINVLSNLIKAIFIKAEQLAVSVEINGTLYILETVDDIKELWQNSLRETLKELTTL